eukprot:Lankesteria_metandrocarpae@DN5328_c0_g1_i2.p1
MNRSLLWVGVVVVLVVLGSTASGGQTGSKGRKPNSSPVAVKTAQLPEISDQEAAELSVIYQCDTEKVITRSNGSTETIMLNGWYIGTSNVRVDATHPKVVRLMNSLQLKNQQQINELEAIRILREQIIWAGEEPLSGKEVDQHQSKREQEWAVVGSEVEADAKATRAAQLTGKQCSYFWVASEGDDEQRCRQAYIEVLAGQAQRIFNELPRERREAARRRWNVQRVATTGTKDITETGMDTSVGPSGVTTRRSFRANQATTDS